MLIKKNNNKGERNMTKEKIINKLHTISNIIDYCNNASDGLMERDALVRSLLKQLSHKKLKELEQAYFENMDKYMQEFHKNDVTFKGRA